MRRAAAALALACALLACSAPSSAQAIPHIVDGQPDEWAQEDVVGTSTFPADPGAPLDLFSLSADDNATHWFFEFGYTPRGPIDEITIGLYLFGPDDGLPAPTEPRGHPFTLPSGAPLVYAIYLELLPAFPVGSALVFFDGLTWKNRSLDELGIRAARNDSGGFVELAAPREALLFLRAGSAAAALMNASASSILDSIPDRAAPPSLAIPGRVPLFDYATAPPVSLTALGFSDPSAIERQDIAIFLELTNAGPKTAYDIAVRILIDSNPVGNREGLTLLGRNGTAVLSFNWTAASGTHNVTARVFPGGASRTLFATFAGAVAILSIESLQVTPPVPRPGETVTVRAVLQNSGNRASEPVNLLLKNGTQVLANVSVPPIPAGGSAQVALTRAFPVEGTLNLRVEIDGVNAINASRPLTITVLTPREWYIEYSLLIVVVGIAAIVGAAWFLTPRLTGARPGK